MFSQDDIIALVSSCQASRSAWSLRRNFDRATIRMFARLQLDGAKVDGVC